MELQDLTTVTLTFHAATLIPLGAALQKFSDRTEAFQKSLAGTTETLALLRRAMATELERDVEGLISRQSTPRPTLVLDTKGEAFTQATANVAASEAYRNCIHEFASRQESSLSAYYALTTARDGWTRWARRVSWSVFLAFAWELVAFGVLGTVSKLLGIAIPGVLLFTTYAPTGLFIFLFVVALAMSLRQHDRILDIRRAHDSI